MQGGVELPSANALWRRLGRTPRALEARACLKTVDNWMMDARIAGTAAQLPLAAAGPGGHGPKH